MVTGGMVTGGNVNGGRYVVLVGLVGPVVMVGFVGSTIIFGSLQKFVWQHVTAEFEAMLDRQAVVN